MLASVDAHPASLQEKKMRS